MKSFDQMTIEEIRLHVKRIEDELILARMLIYNFEQLYPEMSKTLKKSCGYADTV
jgi:hypothetical protein